MHGGLRVAEKKQACIIFSVVQIMLNIVILWQRKITMALGILSEKYVLEPYLMRKAIHLNMMLSWLMKHRIFRLHSLSFVMKCSMSLNVWYTLMMSSKIYVCNHCLLLRRFLASKKMVNLRCRLVHIGRGAPNKILF